MARRKTSSGGGVFLAILVAGLLVYALIYEAVVHWTITVPIGIALIVLLVFIVKRRRALVSEERRARAELDERNRQAWRAMTFEHGPFAVVLTGFPHTGAQEEVAAFLRDVPGLRDMPQASIDELVQRVEHVAPQPLAEGIAQANAIALKQALERRGATAKIKESVGRTSSQGRESIPERVRNEVWRRDGGQCVDCGSRERLEYDHIIPVSRGGANTARNIELRCETCNRRKGAKI